MSNPTPEALLLELQARVANPEMQMQLATIAADATRIAAMALSDPAKAEQEAKYLRASMANIAASEMSAVQDVVETWISQAVFVFLRAAFASAGGT